MVPPDVYTEDSMTDSHAIFTLAYGLLVGVSAVALVWAIVGIVRKGDKDG